MVRSEGLPTIGTGEIYSAFNDGAIPLGLLMMDPHPACYARPIVSMVTEAPAAAPSVADLELEVVKVVPGPDFFPRYSI